MEWINVSDELPIGDEFDDEPGTYFLVYCFTYGWQKAMYMKGNWYSSHSCYSRFRDSLDAY
jgi:hypothetical protein